jgi:hypothetical protein
MTRYDESNRRTRSGGRLALQDQLDRAGLKMNGHVEAAESQDD